MKGSRLKKNKEEIFYVSNNIVGLKVLRDKKLD